MDQLKKLLTQAFASVPYLEQKYRAAGIALEDLRGWDDFRRLPPLTRAEVNAHGPESCSTAYQGNSPARNRWIDGRAHPLLSDLRELRLAHGGEGPGLFVGRLALRRAGRSLWGAPVGKVSTRQAWKRRAYEAVQRQLIVNTFSQNDDLWNDVHARALRFRPLLIVGYVSSLEEFARVPSTHEPDDPRGRVRNRSAEPLLDDTRRRIEDGLGVPLFNT